MPVLYVELISRISGYTGPLRQAAASTKAFSAEVMAQLKALDDAALAGVRTVNASLKELDDRVIRSAQVQAAALKETAASWRRTGTEIKAELVSMVDAQNVASKASIRAAADQARALRNTAAALPRNDPARQALYLQARDYEDQARELQRLRADAQATRNSLADLAMVTGAVLVAAEVEAVRGAVHLQTAMANVATLSAALQGKVTMSGRAVEGAGNQAKVAASNMRAMSDSVLQMSTELPQSAEVLAKSLYDIVSSGFDGSDALLVLHASAVGASAGLTTTTNAAKGIVAVLNAFGLSARQAADVNDIMFQTVNKGVVTYDELAQGLGQYAAMAAQASQTTNHTTESFAQAEAALAAMTLAGVPAVQAATSLNRVYTQLLHPSAALSEAFTKMGFASGQQALQTLGLDGVVQRLTKTYGNNATAALKLFPEIRAARGYLALTANEGRNYQRALTAIVNPTNRAAAAQLALQKQQKTAAYQMTILKNEVIAVGIEFGRALIPPLTLVEKGLQGFVGVVKLIPAPLRDIIGVAALVGGAILLMGGAYLRAQTMMENFQLRTAAMQSEGSALPGLLSLTAKGLGVLTAAMTAAAIVYTIFQQHEQAVNASAQALASSFSDVTGSLDKNAAQTSIVSQLVSKGVIDNLKSVHYTVQQAVAAIEAGGAAYKKLQDEVFYKQGTGDQVLSFFTGNLYKDDSLKAKNALETIEAGYQKAAGTARDATSANAQLSTQVGKSAGSMSAFSTQADAATGSTQQLTDAQKALNDQFSKIVDLSDAAGAALTSLQSPSDVFNALDSANNKTSSTSAASGYNASLKARTAAAEEHARALSAAASTAGKDLKRSYQEEARVAAQRARTIAASDSAAAKSTKTFASQGVVSLSQWESGLVKAGATQKQWDRDLHTIAIHGGSGDLIDSLESLGFKGVAITRQMATDTKPQIDKINQEFASLAPQTAISLNRWTDTLQEKVAERASYMNNLAKLAAMGRTGILNAIEQVTDPKEASALAKQAVDATDRQLGRLGKILRERNALNGAEFKSGLDVLTQIARDKGKATVDELAKQFTGGDVDAMRLQLIQLKNAIHDLGTKHMIEIALQVDQPPPVKVPLLPAYGQGRGVIYPVPTGTPAQLPYGQGRGVVKPHANGGVTTFGSGSENHIAQVARPGDWRVWAEPETGGEAYIPLSPAKRKRSAAILSDVASRFGMSVVPHRMDSGALLEMDLQQVGGIVKLTQMMPFILKNMHQLVGSGGPGGLSGVKMGPASIRRAALTAMRQLGIPDSYLPGVMSIINHEDGSYLLDNVNRADSNWAAGHPSVGLMQVIAGTFDAYAGPYRKTGPFSYGVSTDPVANIYAGLNYAKHRYGLSMIAAGGNHDSSGNYIGYANGGIYGGGRAMRLRTFAGGSIYGGSVYGSGGDPNAAPVIPSAFGFNYTAGASTTGTALQITPYLTPDEVVQDYLAHQTAKGNLHPHAPSLDAFLADLDKSATKMGKWSHDLRKIAHETNSGVATALANMGADGQKYITELANASGKKLKHLTHDIEVLTGSTDTATVSLKDFGSQLGTQVSTSAKLQRELLQLSQRGMGALARQLEAIGGPDAEKLAGEALKHPKRARRISKKAARGARLLSGQDLDDSLVMIALLSQHKADGIHDVAAVTGFDEDTIIRLGNAVKSNLQKLGAKRFLSDLVKANERKPYSTGGYASGPGGPTEDKIPAWLSNGEYVIRSSAVKMWGTDFLDAVNGGQGGPPWHHEGPRYYRAAHRFFRKWAKHGPYQTQLSPHNERAFREWVRRNGVPFDPNASIADYDMRGYWARTGGAGWHQGDHFPDTFKTPYDTSFSRESRYATRDNPFDWRGNRLVNTRTGRLIFSPAHHARGGPVGLRSATNRFGYALTSASSFAAHPVAVANSQMPVIVIQMPQTTNEPLIGSLSLHHESNASPQSLINEVFRQARIANLRRGRRS